MFGRVTTCISKMLLHFIEQIAKLLINCKLRMTFLSETVLPSMQRWGLRFFMLSLSQVLLQGDGQVKFTADGVPECCTLMLAPKSQRCICLGKTKPNKLGELDRIKAV